MYPHERSLVKKHENKPFAIIGVNSDADRDVARQRITEENITWRSFWNGGSTRGPISTAWRVVGWPTIYVIDHEGVIRYKNVHNDTLDRAIDHLLDAMESGGKSPDA